MSFFTKLVFPAPDGAEIIYKLPVVVILVSILKRESKERKNSLYFNNLLFNSQFHSKGSAQ
jgi:hypothetical protein